MALSQSNLSLEDLGLTSSTFPLEKYSAAVSPEGARSHRWTHDLRKHLLQLTFKTVELPLEGSQYEKRPLMVVSAGRETLVSIACPSTLQPSQATIQLTGPVGTIRCSQVTSML
jgi:hypothetical protein